MPYAKRVRRVRCSHCGLPGHNRSTCEEHKKMIEARRHDEGSDDWLVARYDRKQQRKAEKSKNRTCSYCADTGHNRATCKHLAEHIEVTKKFNSAYRRAFYDSITKAGMGRGAIIHQARGVNDTGLFVISSINWENINIWNGHLRFFTDREPQRLPPFESKPLHALVAGRTFYSGYPYDLDMLSHILSPSNIQYWREDVHYLSHDKNSIFADVVSPVPVEAPPPGWFDCEGKTIKKAYVDLKRHALQLPLRAMHNFDYPSQQS